jgi:hypothetical protein
MYSFSFCVHVYVCRPAYIRALRLYVCACVCVSAVSVGLHKHMRLYV